MGERFEFIRPRLPEWTTGLLALICLTLSGHTSGLLQFELIVAGVLFTAAALYFEGKRTSRAEGLAVEYRERFGTALGDAVGPLAKLIGTLAVSGTEHRRRLRGNLEQLILDTLINLCSTREGKRAAFYELRESTLHRSSFTGRSDEPRERFDDGDSAAGEQTHQWMRRQQLVYVEDVIEAQTSGLVVDPRGVQCYLRSADQSRTTPWRFL